MLPQFFTTKEEFRHWLEHHHLTESQLLVGFYKVGSGKPSMTWPESVDQALCFGWIDGIRKNLDANSYSIRFSPRKPNSVWSPTNIRKMEELSLAGLMREPGLAIFNKRRADSSLLYSFEQNNLSLLPEFELAFQANAQAWSYFQSQPKSYRKVAIKWVMTAKQATTREKRMLTLIHDCAEGRKIKPLSY